MVKQIHYRCLIVVSLISGALGQWQLNRSSWHHYTWMESPPSGIILWNVTMACYPGIVSRSTLIGGFGPDTLQPTLEN
jgi:hypothetical protein